MTIDELNVAQKYHIPVIVSGERYSWMNGKQYHINNISQCYNKEFQHYVRSASVSEEDFVIGISVIGAKSLHEFKEDIESDLKELVAKHTGMSYEVRLEQSQRCVYAVDSHYLSIAPGFENMLNANVNELKKDKLSVFLGQCLKEGMTRKEINSLVKSTLDKLERKAEPKFKDKELTAEFEKLWKLYPRKQGKKTALNAYISARKKGTTYEQVEKGIKAYKEIIRKGKIKPEFIKQGGVWFTGERWTDEYTKEYTSGMLSSPPSFDIEQVMKNDRFNDNYDI